MDKLRKHLMNELLDKRDSVARSGHKYISTKCPICDSYSTKRHMDIKLIDGKPITYKCWRASCGVEGQLNREMGRKLGLSLDLCDALENESRRYSKYRVTTIKYHERIDSYLLGQVDPVVADYFNSRTGNNLYELQDKLRITTNITDWQKINNVKIPALFPLVKWESNDCKFIYFFNSTFTTIHYRQVDGDRRGRITLVKSLDDNIRHKPYFVIRNNPDYDTDCNRNLMILAEGPFDMINSYLLAFPKVNGVFVCAGGAASMRTIISEFTKYHYRSRIWIVSDTDVDISLYKRYLLKKVDKRISEMSVFYNKLSKDIGDIKTGINLEKTTLKYFDKKKEELLEG